MAVNVAKTLPARHYERSPLIGAVFMALTLVVTVLIFVMTNSDVAESFPYFFLFPWILALAVVIIAPVVILLYRGQFSFDDPLAFATFSYFIPAFVVGGLMLTVGWSQPYFLSFIQDADYNLPYTMVIIMLGYAGLCIGYRLPVGQIAGRWIAAYLPNREPEAGSFVIPGFLLLGLGIINSISATVLGIIGFQKLDVIGQYDGLIFVTTLFWMEASFILWFIVFKKGKLTSGSLLLIAFLVVTAVVKALLAGNRGSLLQTCIVVGLAYLLSGRRLDFKRTVWAAIILTAAVVAGMIYGTTFRNNKGSESKVGIDTYTENIVTTIGDVGSSDNMRMLEFGMSNFAERIDTVSSLAVVVSTYEQLAPYEESYGLDNNIWKDMTSFFIPRFVWSDKPVASDPRAYSDLYFNYGENSFAITPMGDLLRNYGLPGVFLGMLFLGMLMRTIYRSLIEDQPRMLWRSAVYFMLLTAVSYEAFYGAILPFLFKVGASAVVGMAMVMFFAKSIGPNSLTARISNQSL